VRRPREWRRSGAPAASLAALLFACGALAATAVPGAAAPLAQQNDEPAPIQAGRRSPAGAYPAGLDARTYRVELWIDPERPTVRGVAQLEVAVDPAGAPDRLPLDFTGLRVERVSVDGRPVEAEHVAGRLLVPLPPDAGGRTLMVEVVYAGHPDDGLILRPNVHGAPSAFVDNWPNRTRFWLPSLDHPADKATAELVVHAPAAYQVIANGAMAAPPREAPRSIAGAEGWNTWHWTTRAPVSTYNLVVGVAEFTVVPLGRAACGRAPVAPDGCVEVSAWLFPPDTAQARLSFARAADMVDYYAETFGPFPYAKLAHVQSATRFGGMENASAIFYSERALASGRSIEGTVAHEIAHQWFGDAVTEAEWSHLWLSEGFATYFGAQYFEHADGAEAFRERMAGAARAYLASDDVGKPVVHEEDDLFQLLNRNNYQKGAWVLHMLRGLVGDSAFFAGVREYVARYEHRAVLTDDFRRVMEEAAGRDLGWFFEQWLFRPGYPVFETDAAWDEGAGEAVITVRQTQEAAWPTFLGPLEIEIVSGEQRLRRRVDLRERLETLRVETSGPLDRVVVDPDGWFLHAGSGGDGEP